MHQRGVDITDEARGSVVFHASVAETILRTGEDTMTLGTGDSHIEQATLLLKFSHTVGAHGRREDVFLQTHYKDRGELQSLGGMDGHQRYLGLVGIALAVEVGEQCHLLQEITQGNLVALILLTTTLYEVLHGRKELLKVFLTREVLGVATGIDLLGDAALLDDSVAQLIGILTIQTHAPTVYQLTEIANLGECSLADIEMRWFGHHIPERHTVVRSSFYNLGKSGITDTSCGIVDDTL